MPRTPSPRDNSPSITVFRTLQQAVGNFKLHQREQDRIYKTVYSVPGIHLGEIVDAEEKWIQFESHYLTLKDEDDEIILLYDLDEAGQPVGAPKEIDNSIATRVTPLPRSIHRGGRKSKKNKKNKRRSRSCRRKTRSKK